MVVLVVEVALEWVWMAVEVGQMGDVVVVGAEADVADVVTVVDAAVKVEGWR